MSIPSVPCVDGLPTLLLVEPGTVPSIRAAQLGHPRFCVTQTDSLRGIFLLRQMLPFKVAVLSDELGAALLCAIAESVRWEWPLARIIILGRVPAAMKDQMYDDVAPHSMDETVFLCALGKLGEDPWKQRLDPLHRYLHSPGAPSHPARAVELRESDPTKFAASIPQGVHARDLPSNRSRLHRRG